MSRPCLPQHAEPAPTTCPVCARLADPDPRWDGYRRAFAEPSPRGGATRLPRPARAARAARARCRWRSEQPNGNTAPCGQCGDSRRPRGTPLPLYDCAVHGECTTDLPTRQRHALCLTCDDWEADGPTHPLVSTGLMTPLLKKRLSQRRDAIPVRDCLYHVYPLRSAGVAWRRCCALLAARAALFTGQRLAAVCVGPGLEPPEEVAAVLPGWEVVPVPNDARLREAKTLPMLLERVQSRDPGRALFWGHAKGVTRPYRRTTTAHAWSWLLHEALLDYWPVVEEQLKRLPLAGCFRKRGHGFVGSRSTWHYSGGMFWARSADLFARNWREVDQQWWGSESYPSLHFTTHEAGVIFGDGAVPELDLYNPERFNRELLAFQYWKAEHADRRTAEVSK